MKATSSSRFSPRMFAVLAGLGVVIAIGATSPWWRAALQKPVPPPNSNSHAGEVTHPDHGHDEHAGHDESNSIKLSDNALKNIGFRSEKIVLAPFERVITLPAMVIERPGRSQIEVTAPLTGVVTKISPIQGIGIEPGSALFELRLTHEDLVASQRDFLKTAENLDVVNKEIARLTAAGDRVVAGKRILEQEYEQQKLEGSLKAEQQALLLHGLNESQVAVILQSRELLQSLSVKAPEHVHGEGGCAQNHLYHVQQLPVKLGEQVEAGQVLCVLADHCELLIEARAFEGDATALREATRLGRGISANLMDGSEKGGSVTGLKLLYLADSIDPETRAFKAYLRLPNEVALDQTDAGGQRFIEWRYKPGQRMELEIPVETWQERIVLPVEAVIAEGAESYVYRRNSDHFDRVAVHVEYRGQKSVVIANDGSLFPGDIVATTGAYQIHLQLKNKAGGGVDPHAGHNH